MIEKLKPYAKGIVALVGAVASILAVNYSDAAWFQSTIPVLTLLGVYGVKNAEAG